MFRFVWTAAVSACAIGSAAVAGPVFSLDPGASSEISGEGDTIFGRASMGAQTLSKARSGRISSRAIAEIPPSLFAPGGSAAFLVNLGPDDEVLSAVASHGDWQTRDDSGFNRSTPYLGNSIRLTTLSIPDHGAGTSADRTRFRPWFMAEGRAGDFGTLRGYQPSSDGGDPGPIDMDAGVDLIPLPPAGWTGVLTLAGVLAFGRLRRLRSFGLD